jgi:hypothetical protein
MFQTFNHSVRLMMAGLVLLASGGTALAALSVSTATAASASTSPPWEPDQNSVGSLVFYNSSGDVITSGSTTAAPVAAYVEGTASIRSGDTKATLYAFTPVDGQAPGLWSGEVLGSSTTYPNSGAPGALASATLPLETGSNNDESIAQYIDDYPNNDTSSDGYAGLYQLRLYTSKPLESLSTTYDSVDISVSSGTWSVVYPAPVTSTTTTLTLAPNVTTAYHGTSLTLTAGVTPTNAVGSVKFYSGSTLLSTVAVASGSAKLVTNALPNGANALTATFLPTNSNNFASSSSSTVNVSVSPHPTTTVLKSSAATVTKGKKVTLTATEAPAVAGDVFFYDGSKRIGLVKVVAGSAKLSVALPTGAQLLKAVFKPTNTVNDSSSTSKVIKVTVKA